VLVDPSKVAVGLPAPGFDPSKPVEYSPDSKPGSSAPASRGYAANYAAYFQPAPPPQPGAPGYQPPPFVPSQK
jgi:hypothetical protein